jgi:hypothetical protein
MVEMNLAEPDARCAECGVPIESGVYCENCYEKLCHDDFDDDADYDLYDETALDNED